MVSNKTPAFDMMIKIYTQLVKLLYA